MMTKPKESYAHAPMMGSGITRQDAMQRRLKNNLMGKQSTKQPDEGPVSSPSYQTFVRKVK